MGVLGAELWDNFVVQHPHNHLLQLSGWGELKAQFGWDSQLVPLHKGDALVAGAQILYRRFPARLFTVAYAPKGPLVNWKDPSQVRSLLKEMVLQANQRRAIFLRIEPDLVEGEVPGLEKLLGGAGFQPARRAFQPQRTILVDIRGSEEDLLKRMKQKTRYNIRLAGRKGVVVREGGRDDLAIFNRLMHVTGERNLFGVHSQDYYQAVFDIFSPQARVGLLIAEHEGQALAGLMVFALGDTAWYFYGASGNRGRNLMPTYLLQWEAMRWARSRGCTRYDLWGVPDEDEENLEARFGERSDGLWGVYRHKRGYGGRLIRWVGAFDHIARAPLYWLYERLVS